MQHPQFPSRQNGSSLIEVMVAALLLSMAVVGTFAMHRSALSFTQQAQRGNLIVFATADIAEYMLVNSAANPDDLAVDSISEDSSVNAECTTDNHCTSAEFSAYFAEQWQQGLPDVLEAEFVLETDIVVTWKQSAAAVADDEDDSAASITMRIPR